MAVQELAQTELACSTCAYWRPTKGHFGTCEGFGKPYDGTKKGTACFNYRLSQKVKLPEPKIPRVLEYKSLRGIYNKSRRPKFKATHATNVDGEFVTFTSDIHTKNGYYRHRFNYTIIDVALTLFLNGKTFEQVCSHLEANYMKAPSRRTFREWIIKFLGENAWNERYGNEVFAMCIVDKIPLRKDGKNRGLQQWECKICYRKLVNPY